MDPTSSSCFAASSVCFQAKLAVTRSTEEGDLEVAQNFFHTNFSMFQAFTLSLENSLGNLFDCSFVAYLPLVCTTVADFFQCLPVFWNFPFLNLERTLLVVVLLQFSRVYALFLVDTKVH